MSRTVSLHLTPAGGSRGLSFGLAGIKGLLSFAAYLLPHAKSVKWRSPVGALLMLPAGLSFGLAHVVNSQREGMAVFSSWYSYILNLSAPASVGAFFSFGWISFRRRV